MLIGQTLKDRYHVYDRLGIGGAATVYLARDAQSGQMVIVKLVHPHLINDQFIARFQREIDLLKQINNPHVIRLYDWALREHDSDLNQSLSYIVAEFVEGHSLADIVDIRAPLSEPDALAITRQLALGLADIHNQGIVHRDVKSQNVMVTPENQAKLIDFGIAKGQEHATITAPSHFTGTLYYAPPEQILESRTVDNRADIYSLGVVLYEMLTARLPISDREFGTVASRIIAGKLDPITGVSEPVEDLVNTMLAHEVTNRPDSAQEVIRQIDAITGGAKQPDLRDLPPVTTSLERIVPLAAIKAEATFMLVMPNGSTIPITQAETVIGRSHPRDTVSPDIDLWTLGIEDARTASRRHCRILRQDDDYYIEDLGSMNGTRLNNQVLEAGQTYQIQDGDAITAGRVVLTIRRTNS